MMTFRPSPRAASLMAAALALASSLSVRAEIKLPNVLAEHMVLQRAQPVHLWGTASPGETIHATFRGAAVDATADKYGEWSLHLPAGVAGGPFTLTLHGSETKSDIVFKDILVGDVWVASGQSNMEMPIGLNPPWKVGVDDYKTVLADAHNYPNLRLYHVDMAYNTFPQADAKAKTWAAASAESVNSFSAVGYFFARELMKHESVPQGVMEADVGGTAAESWMSMDALTADASMLGVYQNWATVSDDEHNRLLREEDKMRKANAADRAELATEAHRPMDFYAPSVLWNAMIHPLVPYPVRGFLWYQGDSNSSTETRVQAYQHLFENLIKDWRKQWGEGDLPFYWIQLNPRPGKGDFMGIREAQRRALELPNTGMVVTIDVGDPLVYHSPNKFPVGYRLSLIARAKTYGEPIEYAGPTLDNATPEGNAMVVHFTHAKGMIAKGGLGKSFEVAGADGVFHTATATMQGDTVTATSAAVPTPMYVRYAWALVPEDPLYNSDGLPAAPFTTVPTWSYNPDEQSHPKRAPKTP